MMEAIGTSRAVESAEQLLALCDEDFINCAYLNVLGRQADPTGFDTYLDHIRRGMDKEEVLFRLATSPEGRKLETLRLPGLQEFVDAFRRNRPSLLSRGMAHLLTGALRPVFARLNRTEYRIAQLNDLIRRRFGDTGTDGLQTAFRSSGNSAHSLPTAGAQMAGANSPVRRHGTSETVQLPIYSLRSRLDRRRMNLQRAFGPEIITDRFFYSILSAVRLAVDTKSIVGSFMEDVIVARWLLTGPSADRAFSDLSTQLSALYYSAFNCSHVRRTAAEMDTCNSVAGRALVAEIWPTSYTNLPITAFMLCVIDANYGYVPDLRNPGKRDRVCSEFFLKLVSKFSLERSVTSAQRNALCRSAGGTWGAEVSRLQSWVLETDDNIRSRFAPLDAPALVAFKAWFGDVGLWELGLDFCLREEDLRASQMTLESRNGGIELAIPGYFGAKSLLPDDMDSAETESWLRALVSTRTNDGNLPRRIFAPSIFSYVSNGRPTVPDEPRTSGDSVSRYGVRQLRPGDLLVFCDVGNGPRHLIGRGWGEPEQTHVWTVAETALLAIDLDPEDNGPLDLFLDFRVGTQIDARVVVAWNGRIVELVRPEPNSTTVLICSLGKRHRSGGASNILSLCIDRLFSPSETGGHDMRWLGVALYRLALVRR